MAEKPRNLKIVPRLPIAADAVSEQIVREGDRDLTGKVDRSGDTMTGTLEVPSLIVNGGTAVDGILSTTATLDFPSIATQSSEELTVTLTGAAVGDIALLGPPDTAAGDVSFFAFVSAADTVTVRAVNTTTGAVDPASGTYRVAVLQF